MTIWKTNWARKILLFFSVRAINFFLHQSFIKISRYLQFENSLYILKTHTYVIWKHCCSPESIMTLFCHMTDRFVSHSRLLRKKKTLWSMSSYFQNSNCTWKVLLNVNCAQKKIFSVYFTILVSRILIQLLAVFVSTAWKSCFPDGLERVITKHDLSLCSLTAAPCLRSIFSYSSLSFESR